MGLAAEAVAVDDEIPEVDTRWIEDLARQAARRLKQNGGSPGTFLCEVESLIRDSYLRGLSDARAVCDRLEDEARGWHKDGRPRSFPLRPSRCLGAIECSQAIGDFAEKVV
jgi:hypothetical protein